MGGGEAFKQDRLLVILPGPEPKEQIERIKRKHPHMRITFISQTFDASAWSGGQIPSDVYKDKNLLVTLQALPQPEDCPKLELIHFFSAGTSHIAGHPIYAGTDITLTTSSGIHGPQIAEWVLMTLLVQSRKYNHLYELQKARRWGDRCTRAEQHKTRDMVGQRLGVLGYGSIGRQVANVAKALGMDVIAYTATKRDTPEKRRSKGFAVPGTGDPEGVVPSAWYSGTDKESLHGFLRQDIDVLLIAVPLTPQTEYLLSSAEFNILSRRKAFLVNISRGKIVDQPALIAALQDGRLRGAALDVTDPEPLPATSPLWSMPNVTVTPHISGTGTAYMDRAFEVFEANLERRDQGKRLINVVDRKRGY